MMMMMMVVRVGNSGGWGGRHCLWVGGLNVRCQCDTIELVTTWCIVTYIIVLYIYKEVHCFNEMVLHCSAYCVCDVFRLPAVLSLGPASLQSFSSARVVFWHSNDRFVEICCENSSNHLGMEICLHRIFTFWLHIGYARTSTSGIQGLERFRTVPS